jgi:hypothetical protein
MALRTLKLASNLNQVTLADRTSRPTTIQQVPLASRSYSSTISAVVVLYFHDSLATKKSLILVQQPLTSTML